MKFLILAGGFGTRLKSAVSGVPKALAPVGAIPFLHLQLEHWIEQGVREFTFLLHHQADQIIAFLQAQQGMLPRGIEVDWLIEPLPMGTGGALAYAVKMRNLNGDFLVTNADTWLGSGVSEMMQSSAPAMAVVHLPDVGRYGQVHFDHAKRVTDFSEKTDQVASGWINAGLCRLNAALLNDWDGRPFSLERKLFATLAQQRSMTAVALRTDFIDIGMPSDYHRFCRWVAARRQIALCN